MPLKYAVLALLAAAIGFVAADQQYALREQTLLGWHLPKPRGVRGAKHRQPNQFRSSNSRL